MVFLFYNYIYSGFCCKLRVSKLSGLGTKHLPLFLHNILNQQATLYIQEWDKCTPGESTYDEVLGSNLPQNHDKSSTENGRKTMITIQDWIQLDLCS
ncbi:hypothetical protein VP01_3425g2 [Puccinia sorghi]|uniref:Uncharacterized protein n=1 Tax=Puccinia sorghi TaxID=27349 RepID=A0A0L6UWJ6_9BASI|nr:hypothetical protein VP01_3425g2 [Puccinia sorghi]